MDICMDALELVLQYLDVRSILSLAAMNRKTRHQIVASRSLCTAELIPYLPMDTPILCKIQCLHRVIQCRSHVYCVAWCAQSRRIAYSMQDELCIFDTMECKHYKHDVRDKYSWSVTWSLDSAQLMTTTLKGFQATDVHTGQIQNSVRIELYSPWIAKFSPDGTKVVINVYSGPTQIWDTVTMQVVYTFSYVLAVWSVCWSPDGTKVALSMADKTIRIHDASTGDIVRSLQSNDHQIRHVVWSPDGTRIVSGDGDYTVRIYDVTSGQVLHVLHGHEQDILSLAWSPDSLYVVSCSKEIRIWDAMTGQERRVLRGHDERVHSVSWSPDGRRIVSGSWDGTIRVWDVVFDQSLVHVCQ